MLNSVQAQKVAETAQNLFQQGNIVYKKGGTTPPGMDSGGFIHYCLKQFGIKVTKQGTNSLYREIGAEAITIKEAIKQGKLVPGAILFYVVYDGEEPEHLRNDGRGNADYAGICINSHQYVYPSFKKGKLIIEEIKSVSGQVNMVVFHKGIDYGFTPVNQTS